MDAAFVMVVVLIVYGVYFVLAVRAVQSVWRRTESVPEQKRMLLRSLTAAVLFAPTLVGVRIAPFLLAVVASIVLDLFFVRPMTLAWMGQFLGNFALYMLLPFLVTWALVLVGLLIARHLKQKQ